MALLSSLWAAMIRSREACSVMRSRAMRRSAWSMWARTFSRIFSSASRRMNSLWAWACCRRSATWARASPIWARALSRSRSASSAFL